MKNYFVLMIIAFSCVELFGQKIDGVYYGEIVSPKNTMVLKSNNEQISGVVYLNEKDTVNFLGIYSNEIFKATIRTMDHREIVLEGFPERKAMWLKALPDSSRRFLNKVSSKTNYKIKKLYSDMLDPMLLGRWESFKSIDKNGSESDGKVAYTFFDNNRKSVQILHIPSSFVNRSQFVNNSQLLSVKMEYKWEANGYEITETYIMDPRMAARFGNPPSPSYKYVITRDTLKTFGGKGGYTLYKKR